MPPQLRITLVKSAIGYRVDQKATVKSLGLLRIRQSVVHDDSASVRGMVRKVQHLVTVEPVEARRATR